MQGLLELANVPYVGPGVLASALCMDKDVFKQVMRAQGIPVARHVALRLGDAIANPFGYPVFVKPARLGSSVGISKVRAEDELEAAVALAWRHDEKVLVEEFVPGMEIEVAVLGNLPDPQASLPGQVVSHFADWYDYSSKYDEGGSELVIPPPGLSEEQIERARRVAVQAFVATDCEGMARADFFVRESDGEIVMNELNTIPGFTATSFYTRLFEASGIGYAELLGRLVTLARERSERRRGLAVLGRGGATAQRTAASASSHTSSASSSSASAMVSGQRTRMQFPGTPALSRIRPRCSAASITASASSGAGSFVDGIADELDGEHRAEAAHVADLRVTLLPREHALSDRGAHARPPARRAVPPRTRRARRAPRRAPPGCR